MSGVTDSLIKLAMDERSNGFIVLSSGEGYLVLSQAEGPVELAEGACHVRFNFAAADLEGAAAQMRAAGVQFVGEGRSAVGRYLTFVDPSGHQHNLKALDADAKAAQEAEEGAAGAGSADGGENSTEAKTANTPAIRIYNAGIAVSDMARARAFYEQILGFAPLTEAYYPPVVPYQPGGADGGAGAMFILSDRGATSPAPYTAEGAWAGLAFEAADIASAYQTLKEKGVQFAHEPRPSGPVLHAVFTDPFGNRHELVQHLR
jgi:catechol 2,3-dioxygenase-like lactoylglutathione lyase family enzyme